MQPNESRGHRGRTALTMLTAAAIVSAVAGWSWVQRDAVRAAFGPRQVVLAELYDDETKSAVFDHSAFDTLLRTHVDRDGQVDYEGLAGDADALDRYIAALSVAPFASLGRDEKLALLINAYNAFTLRLILDHDGIDSIKDIPASKRWEHKRWSLGGKVLSLNQIEHEQIRPKFKEPRIHFALVCAARGCPKLRPDAYTGARLDDQLEEQMTDAHRNGLWLRFEGDENVVYLTKLYDWYASDFEQSDESVLHYVARYAPAVKRALDEGRRLEVRWLDYSWELNTQP